MGDIVNSVTIESIIDKLDNIKIIDIRDNYIYNIGNIQNSINIPMNFLIMNPENYLSKYDTYYIYCNMGINSKKACEILSHMGYKVINIIGGYNEYKMLNNRFQ